MMPFDFRQKSLFGEGGTFGPPLSRLILLLVTAISFSSLQASELNTLKEIIFSTLPGNGVEIRVTTEHPVEQPAIFTTDNPARIAIDFHGTRSELTKKTRAVGIGMVRSITAIEAGSRTRLVVNLVTSVAYELRLEGSDTVITIGGGSGQATVPAQKQDIATAGTADRRIEQVDFRRGPSGEGRVILTLSDPSTVIDLREEGNRVVLDLLDTSLPERLMRKFDVSDFTTPVQFFEVSAQGSNVHLEVAPTGNYEHIAYQADNLFTLEFLALSKENNETAREEQPIYDGERLSLNFQDIEVRAVLQLLADFTGFNLVTSDTVTGRLTLRLKNVPSDQAMEIILKTMGLAKRQTGNVIMVAPTEEITARERLEMESQQQLEELASLHSEYIQVNYAKASDIAALLKSEGNQLLTPTRGNITVDERTNTLLVRDTTAKLEDIHRLIQKLDVPVRQVLIESRVVIASDTFTKDLGVRFGFNRANQTGNTELLIGGGVDGHLAGTIGLDTDSFMGANASIYGTDETTENLMVNLPAAVGLGTGGAINLLLGKVGSYLLQLELSAMQSEGKGEVISSPRVITADRSEATIKSGLQIPYQTVSAEGTETQFQEAVLSLEVTPQITPDDHIIMDLVITNNEPDTSGKLSLTAGYPLYERQITTSVLVNNGETVVLGGVFQQTQSSSMNRVPFFGDLPYVGFLFKQEKKIDNNSELLVFVTPKILKESLSMGVP